MKSTVIILGLLTFFSLAVQAKEEPQIVQGKLDNGLQ